MIPVSGEKYLPVVFRVTCTTIYNGINTRFVLFYMYVFTGIDDVHWEQNKTNPTPHKPYLTTRCVHQASSSSLLFDDTNHALARPVWTLRRH